MEADQGLLWAACFVQLWGLGFVATDFYMEFDQKVLYMR